MPCCLRLTIAYSYAQAPKCFQCLIGIPQYMDHLLKCIAFDLWTFPIDSYVQIVSKYGLSSCSFSDIFDIGWFYANECSPQIFLIGWPIASPWFLGSGHSVDFVLAMCAHPLGNHMLCMPKSIYFFNPALQRIMPICGFHWHSRYSIWIFTFVLLHCVWFPGSSCGHKLLSLIIMSWKLVYCIKNSLNAKRLLYLLINFHILCILSNWQWLQLFPIELKVVITQGFSFICFRTVEACTPY